MQVAVSFPFAIFFCNDTWPDGEVLKRVPELAIKMQDVVNKMFGQRPKALPGYNVLLSANMAIPPYNRCAAV